MPRIKLPSPKDLIEGAVRELSDASPDSLDKVFRFAKDRAGEYLRLSAKTATHNPLDLIQEALSGNQDYMNKKQQHEQERTSYKKNRDTEESLVQQSLRDLHDRVGTTSLVDGGYAPAPPAPARSGSVQTIAQQMAAERGWTGSEWDALYDLVNKESSWNPNAANPSSSARGLFQFIDSTAQNYGLSRNASPEEQIRAGLQYIADRYQTPSGALNHWLSRKPINGRDVGNWY